MLAVDAGILSSIMFSPAPVLVKLPVTPAMLHPFIDVDNCHHFIFILWRCYTCIALPFWQGAIGCCADQTACWRSFICNRGVRSRAKGHQ